MKKTIALTLSTALFLNTTHAAFATEFIDAKKIMTQTSINEKQLLDLMSQADAKTTAELQAGLKEILDLTKKLQDIQSTNESDVVLQYANRLQVVLIALTGLTMHAHLKASEANTAILALSTASMAVNTFIAHYKQSHKVDAGMISQIVFDTSRELKKSGQLSPEMREVTVSLNKISSTLLENQSALASVVENLGGTQDVAMVASFGYLILHLVAPKLAKETDGILKNVLPKIQQTVQKTTDAVKAAPKGVALGATGAAGIPDILGMTIGMSSDQSKKLILSTLINLDEAATKLQSEINARQTKQK